MGCTQCALSISHSAMDLIYADARDTDDSCNIEGSQQYSFRAPAGDPAVTRVATYGDMGHSHYNCMQNIKDDAAKGLIDVVVRTNSFSAPLLSDGCRGASSTGCGASSSADHPITPHRIPSPRRAHGPEHPVSGMAQSSRLRQF